MFETVTASEAETGIRSLIDETAETHRPILITTERHNAVLLAEDDWNALQETLYLVSIPGMRESIIESINAPNEDFLSEDEFLNALAEDSGETN